MVNADSGIVLMRLSNETSCIRFYLVLGPTFAMPMSRKYAHRYPCDLHSELMVGI